MGLTVEGAEKIIDRLYRFDQETWKMLQAEIRSATTDIQKDAQADVPRRALRKWGPWNVTTGRNAQVGVVTMVTGTRDLGFDEGRVKASIKPQVRSRATGRAVAGRTIYGRVVVMDPAGAIFMLAGSKNRSGDPFNDRLNRKHGDGPWPRLLGPAWTNNVDDARKLIEAAVNKAAREVTGG